MMNRTPKGPNVEDLERRLAPHPSRAPVATAMAGVAVGAAIGAILGPISLAIGAAIGGAVGAAAGAAYRRNERVATARDRKLDEDIGVLGGDIGAPNLEHPPATLGAFSSASAGAGTAMPESAPDEGPIPRAP